jgi:hypothetical protein
MFAVTHLYPRPTLGAFLLSIVFLALGPSLGLAAAAATSTTLAITASATAVIFVPSGTAVSLTATVKAGTVPIQIGQVKFCDADAAHCTDTHLLGIGQLTTAGTATFKFVPGPGIHRYIAEFSGTATDTASASNASSLTVNAAPSTTTIAQTGATGNYTLKATVTGEGSTTVPSGKISFLDTGSQNSALGAADLGTGTESLKWTTPLSPATQSQPQSVVVADFNGDGIPDIAVAANGTATSSQGYMNVLLGNGDGTFQAAKTFATLVDIQAIVATPFVDGGPTDILAICNPIDGSSRAQILIGDGKGGFTAGTPFSVGGLGSLTALTIGDFNGDGKQDFIAAGSIYGVTVFDVFLGNGDGTFGSGTLNAVSAPAITAIGAGNFTGGSALDLAIVGSDGSVDIFAQDGVGDFFPGTSTTAGTSPAAIVVGDFNGDGKADLAIANSGDDNVTILLGNGSGGFTAAESPATGRNPMSIALGDFNGDGIVDLAVTNSGANSVTVLLGKGDGTFTAEPPLTTGSTPISLATGKFNGEDVSDVAVANNDPGSVATDGTVTILLAQLTQTATATATSIAPTGAGTHLVDASYAGDDIYHASLSATTSMTGSESQAVTPILSPASGTYTAAQKATLTDATPGATIYYTINGTTPTTASTKYTAAITVSTTETIEANAIAAGYTQSIVASAKYTIELPAATPTYSPTAGTYTAAQTVKITSATSGVTIYYTTNGATPTTASTKYTAAIPVAATETIKAIAVATGSTTSAVATAVYTIEKPAATPVFSPVAGTYTAAQSVKMADATAGATIYYTTNGATPTTASTKYTAAINVVASETLKAIAVATESTTSAVATSAYTIEKPTDTPVFSPVAGTYSVAQSVKITDATAGATIYYATNGTTPTTASTKYITAIAVAASETIKAIAVATGSTTSALASAAYTIEKPAATPVFSPVAGNYNAAQSVKIADVTAGAAVYYTTNGTIPTTSSTKYTAAITVAATETIKAIAVAAGSTTSAVATAAYTIEKPAATPVFSPVAGNYTATQSVKITDATAGPTIYYTTNGTTPTTASTKYTAAITVAATETIKAVAVAAGSTTSTVATAAYTIEKPAATPIFSPVAGTYTTAQSVKITDATAGPTIYYTTNGTTPTTASTKYTAAITVAATETIKAIAVAAGSTTSAVATAAYTIEKPAATPVFSPVAGPYVTAQSVKITDATAGAAIYYTTNGSTPTSSSTKYTAAISVTTSETLEAIAIANGSTNSAVATAKFTFASPAAKPTFSVAAGTYTAAQSVQISDATPGATIYYTTNGATPAPASAVYKSAVDVSASEYLQAIAVANGFTTSPVVSALYSIGANVTATPVLSPPPGAYSTSQTVTITDATPGAVITYTTGIGSVTNTYTYTGPFTVSSTEFIALDAIAPGYTHSADTEDVYTIGTVPAPQFSPATGTYDTAQTVNIYDITPSATVYYTTDGTTPTTASALYSGPIVVTANETIRAFATAPKLASSATASAAYGIGKVVAPPAFSLAPGSYTSAQSVTIADITPGTTIYYTINGTTPSTASTRYTGAIAIASTETLEAIAVASGYTNSAVATAAYTIGYPIATFVVTPSGNNVLTIPVGGSEAFTVAAENQSSETFTSITIKTSTGANTSLPVQVTLCQTNPSTGECLAAPAPTVTLSPFAPGASATFSVFVTATAAIASSPSNEVFVLFTNSSGTVSGSASVTVVTD